MFYEVNWTRTINTLERINVKYGETHKQIFAFSIIYYLISHPCWWSNLTVLVCIFTRRCSHTLSEMYSVRWQNTRQRWSLWSKNYKWITPGQGLSLGVRVMRLIRCLLKNFTGFSSLFPCRYSNSINRIVSSPRWSAKCARKSERAERGKKSNPLWKMTLQKTEKDCLQTKHFQQNLSATLALFSLCLATRRYKLWFETRGLEQKTKLRKYFFNSDLTLNINRNFKEQSHRLRV